MSIQEKVSAAIFHIAVVTGLDPKTIKKEAIP